MCPIIRLKRQKAKTDRHKERNRKIHCLNWDTIVSKKHKMPRNKVTNDVQNLYTENYKTLLRKIKEDLNKQRDIPYLWTGRLSILKMTIVSKMICTSNTIPLKTPAGFFFYKLTK